MKRNFFRGNVTEQDDKMVSFELTQKFDLSIIPNRSFCNSNPRLNSLLVRDPQNVKNTH